MTSQEDYRTVVEKSLLLYKGISERICQIHQNPMLHITNTLTKVVYHAEGQHDMEQDLEDINTALVLIDALIVKYVGKATKILEPADPLIDDMLEDMRKLIIEGLDVLKENNAGR